MASQLKEVQDLIGWWGDKTFPNSTADTVLSHLQEEIEELVEAHEDPNSSYEDKRGEIADVFLLAMQYAHKNGIDILDAAMIKMDINMQRDWNVGNPEPGGHVKHVKDSPCDCGANPPHSGNPSGCGE